MVNNRFSNDDIADNLTLKSQLNRKLSIIRSRATSKYHRSGFRLSKQYVSWLASEQFAQIRKSVVGSRTSGNDTNDSKLARFKYMIRAPWPQPNPHAPDLLPETVLHLPAAELKDFVKITIGRLTQTLRSDWISALRFAKSHKETSPVKDSQLVHWLTESLFSRFMTTDLNDVDRFVLEKEINKEGTLYKQDFFVASLVKTLPGQFISGPTVYMRRSKESGRCQPVGIMFPNDNPILIRPCDGEAWELAKHHAILAVSYAGLFGTHPLIHFPVDAINAISKSCLNPENPVSKLLMPHLYKQLCLNFSLMFINKSPLHNDQTYLFTGFTNNKAEGALETMKAVYNGVPDHEKTYPGFKWTSEPEKTHSDYGQFLEGYYNIIHRFVSVVLKDANLEQPELVFWWSECGKHVRNFPKPSLLRKPGELEKVVTYIIWNASVVHSTDHYSFGHLPNLVEWLRLRVPYPNARVIPKLDRSCFTTKEDRFRMFMTHRMHITPNTIHKLTDVDYGFDSTEAQEAQKQFILELKNYDLKPGVTRHAPLDQIATSIQF